MENPPETISISLELLHFYVTNPVQRNVIGGKGGVEISATSNGTLVAKRGDTHYMASVATIARSVERSIELQQEYAEAGGLYLLPIECKMIKWIQGGGEFTELCKTSDFKAAGWDNPENPHRNECLRKLRKLGLL